MTREELEYVRPGRRAGDIARVEQRHQQDPDRPLRICCEGHAFAYDVAWENSPDGPRLTELRLVPLDPTLWVTKRDLLRVNPDRLARAARYNDGPEDQQFNDRTAQRISAALTAGAARLNLSEVPSDVQVSSYREPVTRRRKAGRRPLTLEFYRRVADTAREARHDAGERSVRKFVHERSKTWNEVGSVTEHAVDRWLKKCRELGLLVPGELGGKPKKSQMKDTEQ